MKKSVLTGLAALAVVCLSGCIIIGNEVKPDNFPVAKEGNRVGGGYDIEFIAPEDGTVHLMDRKTGKSILTKPIQANAGFNFHAQTMDKLEYKARGIDVNKADFVLYFYPKYPKTVLPNPPKIQPINQPVPPHAPEGPAPVQPAQ